MSDTKFISGPWAVDEVERSQHAPNNIIGVYVRFDGVDGGRICKTFVNCLATAKDAAANAHLIAAAPELYEALEAIEIALRLDISTPTEILDENSPIMDALRDSLKKARGEK